MRRMNAIGKRVWAVAVLTEIATAHTGTEPASVQTQLKVEE